MNMQVAGARLIQIFEKLMEHNDIEAPEVAMDMAGYLEFWWAGKASMQFWLDDCETCWCLAQEAVTGTIPPGGDLPKQLTDALSKEPEEAAE